MTDKNFDFLRHSAYPTREELLKKASDLRNPYYLPSREEVLAIMPGTNARGEYGDYAELADGSWMKWSHALQFDEAPIFEILTTEFIGSLNKYLTGRIKELRAEQGKPITVAEVGAGNGRLTHFLRLAYNSSQLNNDTTFIATDPFAADQNEWKIKPLFPVEKLDHKSTLKKYQPHLVQMQ